MPSETNRTLQLSREDMRRLGYLVVDTLVEHFETLREQRPGNTGSRADLEALLREDPPEQASDPCQVVARLKEQVFRHAAHVDHPRFFAFVPSPGNFVAAMADALASGFNPFVGTWLAGSGPAQLELAAIDWMRRMCAMPESAGGLFLSGGSMANLTGLAVARHAALGDRLEGACVYLSDQTHSSVERALRVLGFQPAQIRKLASGESFRLPLDALDRAVAADRAAGLRPFCVVANAGATNTGAVDPLDELAGYCRSQNLWLHADGAYGAAAMLCAKGRAALAGIGRVDSLSLDPHKWLFQPFEIGCLLVRDVNLLRDTFRILPDYLKDAHRLRAEFNFCDHGIQLTRGFRALKLWMSIQVFGMQAFREAVEWGFSLAEHAERRLREMPDWEIVSPAQMAIVAFRYAPPQLSAAGQEAVNQRLSADLLASGYAMLSSTTLHGRAALRLCTINPRTDPSEIDRTLDLLASLAGTVA